MNEFTRKAMELADQYENSGRCYLSASPKNAERLRARRDEIRTALLAHLEGAEQKTLQQGYESHQRYHDDHHG